MYYMSGSVFPVSMYYMSGSVFPVSMYYMSGPVFPVSMYYMSGSVFPVSMYYMSGSVFTNTSHDAFTCTLSCQFLQHLWRCFYLYAFLSHTFLFITMGSR